MSQNEMRHLYHDWLLLQIFSHLYSHWILIMAAVIKAFMFLLLFVFYSCSVNSAAQSMPRFHLRELRYKSKWLLEQRRNVNKNEIKSLHVLKRIRLWLDLIKAAAGHLKYDQFPDGGGPINKAVHLNVLFSL